MKKILNCSVVALSMLFILISCNKPYFIETGVHSTEPYKGSTYEYLKKHPLKIFDTLCAVLEYSGMKDSLDMQKLTFFAPPDTMITYSLNKLNDKLFSSNKPAVTSIKQLAPEFWKRQLSYYMFKGEKMLKDYPQLDPNAMLVYGGQYYNSLDGKKMLIGVIFEDAGSIGSSVKYAGYRQLLINYYSGATPPVASLTPYSCLIATSDIRTSTGVLHALRFAAGQGAPRAFGFNVDDFVRDAELIGGL